MRERDCRVAVAAQNAPAALMVMPRRKFPAPLLVRTTAVISRNSANRAGVSFQRGGQTDAGARPAVALSTGEVPQHRDGDPQRGPGTRPAREPQRQMGKGEQPPQSGVREYLHGHEGGCFRPYPYRTETDLVKYRGDRVMFSMSPRETGRRESKGL
ncbi:hypothetical protein [Streptomyces violascens]|uniref:Uncharacterized protein n=1 Tax=Streptomyces violascens TaxID=67381 RepID=A0ABQ3QP87_9ACTN|nr:hypothetical protein [Streptomyces violascens]GGU16823.1 hypothetical protein GCM10010289_43160 [Streptomyces violascens]GHI39089.1 hypothetical protein Sviol_34970 [Streptomyces violascens]